VVIGRSMRRVDKAVASLRGSRVKIARFVSLACTALYMTTLTDFQCVASTCMLRLLHTVCSSAEQGYIDDSIRLIDCSLIQL